MSEKGQKKHHYGSRKMKLRNMRNKWAFGRLSRKTKEAMFVYSIK